MNAEVPNGVTFGQRVLLVPSVAEVFSHSGFLSAPYQDTPYSWIQRGQPIGKYTISLPRTRIAVLGAMLGEVVHEANVPSPVSGLLIHSKYSFADDERDFMNFGSPSVTIPVRMSILLPAAEPPAGDGKFMFSELRECCWSNREPFLQPSRYWTRNALTESTLTEHLDKQLQLKPHYVNALPWFKDYFQEARARYPELRRRLEHLL